ncbi:MAG: Holliday junction branch migration protein RuvA [Oscillospiraceae bacterium]|nr:Holliday junction branch migration protein RuvA [Oscillospiraceae bacterium]
MLYHLNGTVAELGQNLVVIDCGGIGFALSATLNTISKLKIGEKIRLYVAEAIGETNFDLYGFAEKTEKRCFEMLLSVSGIGPKAALSILSYTSPEGLALSVMNNDVRSLTAAPGIGKKIAQRVILELKDKIAKEMSVEDVGLPTVSTPAAAENSNINDALTALTVLGYSSAEVAPILKQMDLNGMDAEQIIKAVLRHMVK